MFNKKNPQNTKKYVLIRKRTFYKIKCVPFSRDVKTAVHRNTLCKNNFTYKNSDVMIKISEVTTPNK